MVLAQLSLQALPVGMQGRAGVNGKQRLPGLCGFLEISTRPRGKHKGWARCTETHGPQGRQRGPRSEAQLAPGAST